MTLADHRPTAMATRTGAWAALAPVVLAACSNAGAAPKVVQAAPPPKDDGKTAQGGGGGESHAAALAQLVEGKPVARIDKQNSVVMQLPDGAHWTRVRFLTVPSLVGFRYGKEHHAIVAAFVTHVADNTAQGACSKSFEDYAAPFVQAFEVELKHDAPVAFAWSPPVPKPPAPKVVHIVQVDPLRAKTATILSHETYVAAWAAYPAWGDKACLVVGVAVPERGEPARAVAVRDRFVSEVLPKVTLTSNVEPPNRF
jgi:hypothetical protein